ncbi:phosphonate ABC transporter, permease protein PhnE, partial [Geobacillus sp. MMMUD3]|nr:phosphonate ABC transporter, permease protein PhnE [Geobacillus sp. MMMUD3]
MQSFNIANSANVAFGAPEWVTGLIVAVVFGVIVIGGTKRITAVADKAVPFMAAGYILLAIVVIVVLHVVALRETDFSLVTLVDGRQGMANFLSEAFPPNLDWTDTVWPGIQATGITLWIGLLGTTLSIPTSALLAVLGSRTTSPHPVVYQVARAIMSFLRAVPDIVFALVFVTAVGLGPFPGVLALIFHNTGVMGKLWSEAIEEIDPGPSEALATAGAKRSQIVANATFPQVVPQLFGLLLYRFDVNVRSSLVLGLVGAGGIGLLINQSIKS